MLEDAFVLIWNEEREVLKDITLPLKKILDGYSISRDVLEQVNQRINNLMLWQTNEQIEIIKEPVYFRLTGMDATFISQRFSLPARGSAGLHVEMKVIPLSEKSYVQCYKGRLYWATDKKSNFSETRSYDFWLSVNRDYNHYIINFIGPDEIFNDETIIQFKLMPALFPAEVEIKEIRLE